MNSFLKIIFRRAYPGNPLDYLKTDTPMFEHGFLPVIKEHSISHPSPPPPARVGDHNAMLEKMRQEKISHYTTGSDPSVESCSTPYLLLTNLSLQISLVICQNS